MRVESPAAPPGRANFFESFWLFLYRPISDFTHISVRHLVIGIIIFVLTFAISLGAVTFILLRLPPTYFQEMHQREFLPEHSSWLRWTGLIAKNILGVLLVLLGIIMSIPGVPGQ